MTAHPTHIGAPQVLVVGRKVDGEWWYMRGEPIAYAAAMTAVKSAPHRKDTVVFALAADDPKIEQYPRAKEQAS